MRVLVTGASGFLGGHIVHTLGKAGHAVAVVVREGSNDDRLAGGVTRILYDGATEPLHAGMAAFEPDMVVHLASRYVAQHRPDDVVPLVASNILFGAQLLDAMARCGVRRLVNFGTSFQHFDGDDYHPVSLYAATKQAFEDLARYYVEAQGLAMLTLKLSDTYGPQDERGKIIALLARAAASGETLELSPGEQIVNFAHSADVVAAVEVALDHVTAMPAGSMEAYAVRGAESLSLRAFVETFADVAGCPVNVRWGARPYREREVMVPWLGPVLPGWQPRIDLATGLKALVHV